MESVSLQNLIKDVADEVTESYEGSTTAPGTNTVNFIDARFAVGVANYLDDEWLGSEVVFEEPAYTAAGCINPGPHIINDFISASGTFASNLAFRTAGVVPSGLNYFLIRPRGQGTPYKGYLKALRYALDELNVSVASDDTTLTTVASTYDYTIPAGIAGVYDVWFTKSGYLDQRLRPGLDWEMKPGRKLWLQNQNLTVSLGWTLHLHAVTESPVPATLDGVVYCPRSAVVDLATEYLLRNRPNPPDNARAQNRQQERLRYNRLLPRANLRMVLP